jgi:hypothetical protein
MKLLLIPALAGVAAFASATIATAQQSMLVPLVEVERTDNAFGRTTSDTIFQNGSLVTTPQSLRAVSDTKLSLGALWLNAVRTDLGAVPLTITPFFRHTSYVDNNEDVTSLGASFKFTLYEGGDDKLEFTLTPTRVDATWASNHVDSINARLRYQRTMSDRRRLTLGLSGGETDSNVSNGTSSTLGLEAAYRQYLGDFEVTTNGNIKSRSTSHAGGDGTDYGFGLTVETPMGDGDIFTSLDATWTEDDAARTGQPFAREVTTTSIEIGYAYPLDPSGLARLVVSAEHENADANLGLYESSTNAFGIKLRSRF